MSIRTTQLYWVHNKLELFRFWFSEESDLHPRRTSDDLFLEHLCIFLGQSPAHKAAVGEHEDFPFSAVGSNPPWYPP
ncbi:hypothetical protein EST38_g299 [Candolleomyces aberdarensis]|uniref:Uncharacterized protein n=1 Tax=Candolleomyces aberdarensis TaxID=2316362 RepID=A0A4Q2DZN4_9AGAR|nr:hypothetical protein EST38_g299 [Candolleomyces aberdarensis]